MAENLRVLIVGGVAGGASCAARARRISESAEIIMFDRGAYVSFANCGLPYYVGDVIKKEENLLIATPELFRKRFNIDVRLHSEVVGIDRTNRCITVKNLESRRTHIEPYDALVLSPGARQFDPICRASISGHLLVAHHSGQPTDPDVDRPVSGRSRIGARRWIHRHGDDRQPAKAGIEGDGGGKAVPGDAHR